MWLTKLAINRRVTIAFFIVFLIVLGYKGLRQMPWELNPKVEFPMVTVSVPYPGADPEEIEQRIVKPLEDAVSIINGIDELTSVSLENAGTVAIQFKYGTPIDTAAADVRDAVDRTRALFPDGAKAPSILKVDINAVPVITVGFFGKRPPRDLRKLIEDSVSPRLGQVPGVASIIVTGGAQREIQVLARRERLDAVGLSVAQFAQLVGAQNLRIPAGSIKEGKRDYAVRMLAEYQSMDEIRNLKLATPLAGIVRLSDIADVADTIVEQTAFARVDRKDAVTVSIVKAADANTVEVIDGVKQGLKDLVGDAATAVKGTLPSDVNALISSDDSIRVRESIKDVSEALMYGALLAALVTFIFLHNFRGMIIVALAIPTSMMATFLPISLGLHFTLNMMTMLALSLSVGILVDDSIVVLENITRHLEMGEQPAIAAYNGRTEIGAAAVAITMVDVVVFIPIAFVGGIVGQFFRPFGLTAATCTLFSMLMSFSLTPMLASWWFVRHRKPKGAAGEDGGHHPVGVWARSFDGFERGFGWVQGKYRGVLRRAVAHPFLTLFLGYMVLVLVMVVITVGPQMGIKRLSLGFEMFPVSDESKVSLLVEGAPGTRLEQTDRVVRAIEARLSDTKKYPEIEHVTTTVGLQGAGLVGGGESGPQYGQVRLTMFGLNERRKGHMRSDDELARQLRRDLADIPSTMIKVNPEASRGGPGGAPVTLDLYAEDLGKLSTVSVAVAREVAKIPGLLYVDLSSKPGRPEARVMLDRERAADLGITAGDVGAAVRTAIAGNNDSKFRESGDEYDLRVQFPEYDRSKLTDVADLFVGVSRTGQPIRIRDVAHVVMGSGPTKIERVNRQRKITVSAYLDNNILALGKANDLVNASLVKMDLQGVHRGWSGMVKIMKESFGYLFSALALAVLLVYLLAGILYNSPLEPMNIILIQPMALVGAIIGLLICHMTMSMVAMIGIIMLIGIVGKNAILVVDYTNTLRARGYSRTEALLEAGPVRMRPVLMTTAAVVLGMLPTALATNEGSEWRRPMAVVVIFGVLLSTLLSLVVVPASYVVWDRVGSFATRMARKVFVRPTPTGKE